MKLRFRCVESEFFCATRTIVIEDRTGYNKIYCVLILIDNEEVEVLAMKGCMSTDLGIITIDPEVIAKYAGTVAVECFGIVGMAAVNMKDGLVHLLKKESLTRGIHVNISDDNHISIDFHIIVAYGVSISAVTDNLISDVKYRVEEFSGMQVDKINVYIEGVRVID